MTHASLARGGKGADASPLDRLTFREGEIFKLLSAGLKNGEIGRRLDVTEKTVKRYVTQIFEKLHVRNRVEAALLSKPGLTPPVIQNGRLRISLLSPPIGPSPLADAGRKGSVPDEDEPVADPVAASNGKSPPQGNGRTPRG